MKSNSVLITGLYRSGTTFIEKAVDSHEHTAILHQPINLYFKTLDEFVWTQMKDKPWPDMPMGFECFWDLYDTHTLKDMHFDDAKIKYIIDSSRSSAVNHPGKNSVLFPQESFYDLLDETLKPGNAEDILVAIFECIRKYRGHDARYAGLKEIFLSPYLPFMAGIKDLTIINVIRDPREIYFSRNYNAQKELFGSLERHPVKMIATIWRNHILINAYLKNRYNNIIDVYYDDIRDNADNVTARLLQELDLSATTDKDLKDESGKEWTINTSDKSGKPGFGKKWQAEMDRGQVAMIEHICGDLMETSGYKRYIPAAECEALATSYQEDITTLKEWTKKDALIKL